MSSNYLDRIIQAQKRGEARGIYSICSAHPIVLAASMRFARGGPLLIESTCNQVNQYGGYTGMRPAQFVRLVHRIAGDTGFPKERLIFGGDHLGPLPWSDEPAGIAMKKARALVLEYVRAGYTKIHLDASMPCKDDEDLSLETIAARTVELARVAEQAGPGRIRYVVGSEVPTAGGARAGKDQLRVTSSASAKATLESLRAAFLAAGLRSAWNHVVALVVQPGVEFGDALIHHYQRRKAAGLKRWVEPVPHLVYEAHSTDYQARAALREMVEDHFAILKVGPALTFALREAVYALEEVEQELGFETPSHISQALESAMMANPVHWKRYYEGNEEARRLARRYSLSDRIRYYWTDPGVVKALQQLLSNLDGNPPPWTLLSQYLPLQYRRLRAGLIPNKPMALIEDYVMGVLEDYSAACGVGVRRTA